MRLRSIRARDRTAVSTASPSPSGPHLVYVWKDRFPNGYPTTPEEFMTEAERLKGEGLYAITFFGSTDFDGNGLPAWSGRPSPPSAASSTTARAT